MAEGGSLTRGFLVLGRGGSAPQVPRAVPGARRNAAAPGGGAGGPAAGRPLPLLLVKICLLYKHGR